MSPSFMNTAVLFYNNMIVGIRDSYSGMSGKIDKNMAGLMFI